MTVQLKFKRELKHPTAYFICQIGMKLLVVFAHEKKINSTQLDVCY